MARHVRVGVLGTALALVAWGGLMASPSGAATTGVTPVTAGANWNPVTQLAISGDSVRPQAISATSNGDVWVVGYDYTGLEFRVVVLRRHNGSWSRVSAPDVETAPAQDFLAGVDAVSPTDVWMVGSSAVSSQNFASQPLVEHWDGTSVSIVPVPDPSTRSSTSLAAISGTAKDLWAVGVSSFSAPSGFVLHSDGTQWSVVPFRLTVPGCTSGSEQLTSVADVGKGIVYVGGTCHGPVTGQVGFVQERSGGTWTLSAVIPEIGQISGLTSAGDGTVWAVGYQQLAGGGAARSRAVALHGSGHHFTWVGTRGFAQNAPGFAAVAATPTQVVAVGTGPSLQPPFSGFGAYTLSGSTWVADRVVNRFGGFGSFWGVTRDSTGHLLAAGFGLGSDGHSVAIVSQRSG